MMPLFPMSPKSRVMIQDSASLDLWLLLLAAVLAAFGGSPGVSASAAEAKGGTGTVIERIPENYQLYAYDDCGIVNRQPHVDTKDSYNAYNAPAASIVSKVSVQQRSAVFSHKEIRLVYEDLDPTRSYILALTYGNRGDDHWAQRLEADGVSLHGPLVVAKGQTKRVLVQVPPTVTQDGKMRLRIRNLDGTDAMVSIVELWATGKPKKMLRIATVLGTPDGLSGHVMDMAYQGVENVPVRLVRAGDHQTLATAMTKAGGAFTFPKKIHATIVPRGDLDVIASHEGLESRKTVSPAEQFYAPVRFRPLAAAVAGLKEPVISLDGSWQINPNAFQSQEKPPGAAPTASSAPGWGDFHVPGQWAQQGYDIPQDRTVALTRQFVIPAEWTNYRIFVRFDAIHGGTHYWLNGKSLGYSENLFTPVEWEITEAARPGQENRLDLAMVVATKSEELSKSCNYTSYSLGGIDRCVRIFALPKLHLATLRVNAGLDRAYRDGELRLDLGLDNSTTAAQAGLEASVQLYDADDNPVAHSIPRQTLEPLQPGRSTVTMTSRVPQPRKWNAEQPNLYKLVLELRQNSSLIQRIERNIGFRTIEAKGRQIYVNGVRVKLAGVCHLEIDPLTGRADTKRHAETDAKFFKSANLNYVRTTTYPSTQEFLDATDRLGLYIELEAPLNWVTPPDDLGDLKAMLTPISAMIDDCHMHPSIITYSLANESFWSPLFDLANKLCKQLDPTRLTTFNSAIGLPQLPSDAEENCDIVNQHYPKMPFDKVKADDPRPFLVGECFFEVYHERTDVTINPGMRELWAHGSAEPDSAWGKYCDAIYSQPAFLRAGIHPGAWSHIYASDRCIGSEIWSGVDDIAFLKNGTLVSSENNNAYWGLIDGWRRAKPELWLAKAVFSPVWFVRRHVDYRPGQTAVHIPLENRYAFTNFNELDFTWELDGKKGKVAVALPPAMKGEIVIPIRNGTAVGKKLLVRATDGKGELVNAATITLGTPPDSRGPVSPRPELRVPERRNHATVLPQPRAGAPKWTDDGKKIVIEGNMFALVVDRATGDLDATNPKHKSPLVHFPSLHVTRYDCGDLNWLFTPPPYAEFPDAKTRVVDSLTVTEKPGSLDIAIKDHFQDFAGAVHWRIDNNGVGRVSYDYAYTGKSLETREVGIKALLNPQYDEVRWRRWSEWGDIFPDESISRTVGRAKARRDSRWPETPANVRPTWPWSLDQTALGTNDFRAVKFSIYEASLVASDGSGIGVHADANLHFRPCLSKDGVKMHVLTQCTLAPVVLKKGDRLKGECVFHLLDGTQGTP